MSETKLGKSFVLFLSSCRPDRKGNRLIKIIKKEVEAQGNKLLIFDPMNMNFEVIRMPLHFMPNADMAPAWLKEANQQLECADAFIFVTAEYNSSLPPALTNMLDHFPPASYRHRPCGIISYSAASIGGIRAQTLLPILTIELGMLNLPRHVCIPKIQDVFDEKGECNNYKIVTEIVQLIHDVDWFAEAIRNKKKKTPLPS